MKPIEIVPYIYRLSCSIYACVSFKYANMPKFNLKYSHLDLLLGSVKCNREIKVQNLA